MEEKEQGKHKTAINNNLMREEEGIQVEEKEGDILNLVQQ